MRFSAFFIAALLTWHPANAESTDAAVLQLMQNRDELQSVPFPQVIKATTGKRVLPVIPRKQAKMLAQLGLVLDATLKALNDPKHPIHGAGRVNEASRYIEDEIRKQVNLLRGWKCSVPITAQGREQRSGYPDLRIQTDRGTVFYLDPKLYEAGSRDSSLRTFYYEPKTLTGKIHEDAMHLLVGIAHAGETARALRLKSWELVDLSKLKVQLKAEFQAGNRDVYRPEMIVGRSTK
jgi:hypothetical protein